MSKKDSERDSLRYLETPTAAFPIGSLDLGGTADPDVDDEQTALRNIVEDFEEEPTRPRRLRPHLSEDETETEVRMPRANFDDVLGIDDPAERAVHPGLVALSLLGGGILAVGVVAVFGMWLLNVN